MAGFLRIGELSRRTGVAPEVLRAWETRYGLLRPDRSPGGFRLYADEDVERVETMNRLLGEGLSAAQAAARALTGTASPTAGAPSRWAAELARALDALDEGAAQAALDGAIAELSIDAVLEDVVLPYLVRLGERWERGDASIAQEHFASALLRGRLLGLARGWGRGGSPHAVLACGPDEEHDLPLICLGLALRARGWRVTYLGARTPLESVVEAVERMQPDACVVSATVPLLYPRGEARLRELATRTRLVFGGPGADPAFARRVGATTRVGSLIEAAEQLG